MADVEPTERVRCSGCGYNLAGLEPDSVCPECGASRRTRREWGREAWVPGVALGLSGIATALLACLWPIAFVLAVLAVVLAIGSFFVTRPRLGGRSREQAIAAATLGTIVALISGVLMVVVMLAWL